MNVKGSVKSQLLIVCGKRKKYIAFAYGHFMIVSIERCCAFNLLTRFRSSNLLSQNIIPQLHRKVLNYWNYKNVCLSKAVNNINKWDIGNPIIVFWNKGEKIASHLKVLLFPLEFFAFNIRKAPARRFNKTQVEISDTKIAARNIKVEI